MHKATRPRSFPVSLVDLVHLKGEGDYLSVDGLRRETHPSSDPPDPFRSNRHSTGPRAPHFRPWQTLKESRYTRYRIPVHQSQAPPHDECSVHHSQVALLFP